MKEKDLPCFGLVFTVCSVLGRLCVLKQISVQLNLFVFGSFEPVNWHTRPEITVLGDFGVKKHTQKT